MHALDAQGPCMHALNKRWPDKGENECGNGEPQAWLYYSPAWPHGPNELSSVGSSPHLFIFIFFFRFLGCTCGIWEFPG